MTEMLDRNKRSLFVGLAAAGAAAGLAASVSPAAAQLLDNGVDPKSVLAKVKKGATLDIGYAQTPVGSSRIRNPGSYAGSIRNSGICWPATWRCRSTGMK